MLLSNLMLLSSASHLLFVLGSSSQDEQAVLAPPQDQRAPHTCAEHAVDNAVLAALKTHSDPVAALLSLQPESAAELAQPRLLHVIGEQAPEWMTEGDKLRLRRQGKKFLDITDHEEFYAQQLDTLAGKASMSFLRSIRVLSFTRFQISPIWRTSGLSSHSSLISRRRGWKKFLSV
jgi:leucyl aminopeptidase